MKCRLKRHHNHTAKHTHGSIEWLKEEISQNVGNFNVKHWISKHEAEQIGPEPLGNGQQHIEVLLARNL